MPRVQELPGRLTGQATQNPNGTINWRALYGEEAFRLKQPLFESDLQRMRAEKQINFDDLARQAKEFAEARKNNPGPTQNVNPYQPNIQVAGHPQQQPQQIPGKNPDELPPGWAATKDTAGRVYYWHTKTKKTTWDRPTLDTPIQ